jgi:GAF domain-containing protein
MTPQICKAATIGRAIGYYRVSLIGLGIGNRLRFRDDNRKMLKTDNSPPADKPELYRWLADQLRALLGDETDLVANAANTAALIYHTLPDINWAGFYFLKGDELVLGPFQGKPACVRIQLGKGVCGTAAAQRKTLVVPDVHKFPGHIACDSASNSEIVVPLIQNNKLLGVLDVDSPILGRFDEEDQKGLEILSKIFVERIIP